MDKHHAPILSTIYWAICTLFRFVVGHFSCTISLKLILLSVLELFIPVITIILILSSESVFALYFFSAASGIALSPLYPFILAVSKEYWIALSGAQMGTVLLAEGIADIFPTIIGVLLTV